MSNTKYTTYPVKKGKTTANLKVDMITPQVKIQNSFAELPVYSEQDHFDWLISLD